MSRWNLIVGAGFAMSVCLSGIVVPEILLIAFRKILSDEPDE